MLNAHCVNGIVALRGQLMQANKMTLFGGVDQAITDRAKEMERYYESLTGTEKSKNAQLKHYALTNNAITKTASIFH